jgi:hypothetical protein
VLLLSLSSSAFVNINQGLDRKDLAADVGVFYGNGELRFYHLALHAILLPHAIHLPTACLLLAVITSNQVTFLPSLSTVLSLRLRNSEQA